MLHEITVQIYPSTLESPELGLRQCFHVLTLQRHVADAAPHKPRGMNSPCAGAAS